MADRDIDSLDELRADSGAAAVKPEATAEPTPSPVRKAEPAPPVVDLNYPEPTLLSAVVKDVARWSRLSFVMEPSVNTKIQIFAPRKLHPYEAYDLFLASLAVVSLRAVQHGNVVKIVPVTLSVSA